MMLVLVTYLDGKWDMSFRVKIDSQMSLCHSGASKNDVRAEREGKRKREGSEDFHCLSSKTITVMSRWRHEGNISKLMNIYGCAQ